MHERIDIETESNTYSNESVRLEKKGKSISAWIEAEVRNNPYKIISLGKEKIPSELLNRKANKLARYLITKYEKSDIQTIGIMIPDSIEQIIVLIAILKAGYAGYVIDNQLTTRETIEEIKQVGIDSILCSSTQSYEAQLLAATINTYSVQIQPQLTSSQKYLTELDNLPFPNRALIDYGKYDQFLGQAMSRYTIAIQATRGCPYKCLYCHKIWPKSHAVRSYKNILEEINIYYDMGVRRFSFIDDIFNLHVKNSTRFFESLIKKNVKVQLFFPNGIRADILTRDYIDLMAEAGTINVAFALETGSLRLQRLIKKNLRLDKIRKNLDYICNSHPQIITELFTMHGFPSETKKEAFMTLDFIKNSRWIHFPYIFILKIFSNTDMEKLAMEMGITKEAIKESQNMLFRELPATLPFPREFTVLYQTDFFYKYFLNKMRLLKVLPYQMKVLTEKELVQKYQSYLPIAVNSLNELLNFINIKKDQLPETDCVLEESIRPIKLEENIKKNKPLQIPSTNALRILLLDLSQYYTDMDVKLNRNHNLIEPPLGLMYLMSYLDKELGNKVYGKLLKSRIDFDSYNELMTLINEFNPHVIGIRTLSFFKGFFHATIAVLRQWGFKGPIIAGGPYASSEGSAMLQDSNLDIAVIGEGEVVFAELVKAIIENNNTLPSVTVLENIPGIMFISDKEALKKATPLKDMIIYDQLGDLLHKVDDSNLSKASSIKNIVSEKIITNNHSIAETILGKLFSNM